MSNETKLPTVDEILGGSTQGGVAPPLGFKPHEDDGTVQRVGRAGGFFTDRDISGDAAVAPTAAQAAAELKAARGALEDAERGLATAQMRASSAEQAFHAAVAREHDL